MNIIETFSRIFGKGTPHHDGRDFSLLSGERQVGKSLQEIRKDHVVRYEYAARTLSSQTEEGRSLFGLDVFCATGYGTQLLSDRTGAHVLGVDASSEAISLAIEFYSNERTFFASKYFPFSLPAQSFDFIVCFESVEHVENYEAFLGIITMALKDGGLLFLSTPNSELWSLEKNPNPFHYKHFSKDEIVALVEGFERMKFLEWLGQDIYRFEEQLIADVLPDEEMGLVSERGGQIHLTLFQKQPKKQGDE